jgi:hypothetical protein
MGLVCCLDVAPACALTIFRGSEQLKSIRQDVTVQNLRSTLAVDTYETHGRVALEAGDLAEFMQCASVLRELHISCPGAGCPPEWTAYRLLHALCAGREAFAAELRDAGAYGHPYVAHAVAVAAALHTGNAAAFFRLQRSAPRMAPYLMDRLAPALRSTALAAALAAYRPGAPAAWFATMLCFDSASQCVQWAQHAGAAHIHDAGDDDGGGLLCAPGRLLTECSPRPAVACGPLVPAERTPAPSFVSEVRLSKSKRRRAGN